MSGLNQYLFDLIGHIRLPPISLTPSIYACGIFTWLNCNIPRYRLPNDFKKRFNIRMLGQHQIVEHSYADQQILFQISKHSLRLKLFDNGIIIQKVFLFSSFVQNCCYSLMSPTHMATRNGYQNYMNICQVLRYRSPHPLILMSEMIMIFSI